MELWSRSKVVNSADAVACRAACCCRQTQTTWPHNATQRDISKNNATAVADVPDNDASQHSYLLQNRFGFCPASDDGYSASTIQSCSPRNCHYSNHVLGHFQPTFPETVTRHVVYTPARLECSVFCGPQRSRCRSCFFACYECVQFVHLNIIDFRWHRCFW